MRYIVVSIDTPPQEIDRRCEELTALGAGGCMIESEDDFQDFLDENRQYWMWTRGWSRPLRASAALPAI